MPKYKVWLEKKTTAIITIEAESEDAVYLMEEMNELKPDSIDEEEWEIIDMDILP